MDGLHTIISSNMRFDNPGDGILCWEMRKPVLARILNSHRPLILGTQEGRYSQHMELVQELPSLKIVSDHRSWIDERMYPSLYVKTSLTPSESGDAWLSPTPDVPGSKLEGSAFPRLCTWMKLVVDGVSLVVVNLHLDFLDSPTRLQQCQILCGEIHRHASAGERVIVMGDFNDHPGSAVHQWLLRECLELYDPWTAEEGPSHHSFSGMNYQGHRIDWILLDRRIQCQEIFLDKTREGQIWPSDHFPLVCRIKL